MTKITRSFQDYGVMPSAVISDGPVAVPLWGVTTMSLAQTYHLPPIGSKGARAIVAAHDDTVTLTGVLVGVERYAWKAALELLAETSKRGGVGQALAGLVGANISGLILITSMTIRTDMQIQTLTFNANATKRDVIDVTITLVYMPAPGALGKLLDLASIGVGALADFGGQ